MISFEPAHAPEKLADVRAQVEKDARTLRDLKQAEAAARKLAAAAEKTSLKQAFDAQFASAATQPATTQPYGASGLKMLEDANLTRKHATPMQMLPYMQEAAMPMSVPGMQNPEPVIKACFDLAGPATTTQPVNKVTVVELPDQKAWVVAQVIEHEPARQAQFDSQKPMLAAESRLLKIKDFYGQWFNPKQIQERTGWKPTGAMQTE